MLMRDKGTGDLIEIIDLEQLASPFDESVAGRNQSGQEEQDAKKFPKANLTFPSGEALPQCWIDSEYQADSSGAAK